jgi:hypothetical protein
MFAVIYKNKVILGPTEWDRAFYKFRFRELGVNHETMPKTAPSKMPYVVDENTKIVPATVIKEPINAMIQYRKGPLWTFDETSATALYQATDMELSQARGNFRRQAADERYKKEVSGTKITIQETEVTLDTSREGRNIFIQKLSIMNDDDVINWKFPEGWFAISKAELTEIVLAGAAHIQSAFDWEKDINDQIDQAETSQQLLDIEIVKPMDFERNIPDDTSE